MQQREGNPCGPYAFDMRPNPQMVKSVKGYITQCWLCMKTNYGNSQTPLVGVQWGMLLQRVIWHYLVIWVMLIQVYTLEQRFSNFSLSQNHREDLLKHTFLGPTSRGSNSVGLEKELRICILTCSRYGWGPHFENHSPRQLFTDGKNEM